MIILPRQLPAAGRLLASSPLNAPALVYLATFSPPASSLVFSLLVFLAFQPAKNQNFFATVLVERPACYY